MKERSLKITEVFRLTPLLHLPAPRWPLSVFLLPCPFLRRIISTNTFRRQNFIFAPRLDVLQCLLPSLIPLKKRREAFLNKRPKLALWKGYRFFVVFWFSSVSQRRNTILSSPASHSVWFQLWDGEGQAVSWTAKLFLFMFISHQGWWKLRRNLGRDP